MALGPGPTGWGSPLRPNPRERTRFSVMFVAWWTFPVSWIADRELAPGLARVQLGPFAGHALNQSGQWGQLVQTEPPNWLIGNITLTPEE